jgi:uncharacterized protein (DUF983 family)
MMSRGVFRRCPWCGGRGAFFTGWFAKAPNCQTCGLMWRRGDVGFELGAAAIAAAITLGPLIVALAVVMAITWPTIAVVPMLAGFVPAALILPVLLYPISYTIWQALDLVIRPAKPDDFDVAFVVDGSIVVGADADADAVDDT